MNVVTRQTSRGLRVRLQAGNSAMCQQVDIRPAGQVERGARWQEVKAGLCKMNPVMAFEHDVQPGLEFMQEEHVIGRIFQLFPGQLIGTQVRTLLLF